MTRRSVTVVALTAALLAYVVTTWAGRPVTGSALLSVALLALPLAGIYALSATGLVVVYSTTGIFNFAEGAIGMFAAYLYWQITVEWGWPTWVAIVLIVAVVAPLLGAGTDRLIMRHLHGKPLVTQLMVTVGLLFGALGLVNTIWDQQVGRSVPFLFGGTGFRVGAITLTWHRVTTVVVSLVLVVGLRIFLHRSRVGIAMRAVVDNARLAELGGLRPSTVSMTSWGLGASLAAVAGILLAPETDMSPGGSLTLLIIAAFAAAAVGRLRSLPLTYLGAVVLAAFTVFSQSFLELGGRWRDVPAAYPAVMLLVVLLLLPESQLISARAAGVRRRPRVTAVPATTLGMSLVVLALAAVSSTLGAANVNRLGLAMCTALVLLSLVPLTGWAGQVSLAPLAFASIGAITYSHLAGSSPATWMVPVAALAAVPIGALLALPALRLQGLYLALATFAFATVCSSLLFAQPFAFAGQSISTPRLDLFGLPTSSGRGFLIATAVVFTLTSVALAALFHSKWGRRFIALRDSEVASSTIGINVIETKLIAFMLSAFLAGLGGVFLGMFYEQTDASAFQPLLGLSMVLLLVIGGVAQPSGALVAGLLLVGLSIAQDSFDLSILRSVDYLIPGLAAIAIIAIPDGVVVAVGSAAARWLPRRSARGVTSDATEADPPDTDHLDLSELGLSIPFHESDVAEIDQALGLSDLISPGRPS